MLFHTPGSQIDSDDYSHFFLPVSGQHYVVDRTFLSELSLQGLLFHVPLNLASLRDAKGGVTEDADEDR